MILQEIIVKSSKLKVKIILQEQKKKILQELKLNMILQEIKVKSSKLKVR